MPLPYAFPPRTGTLDNETGVLLSIRLVPPSVGWRMPELGSAEDVKKAQKPLEIPALTVVPRILQLAPVD